MFFGLGADGTVAPTRTPSRSSAMIPSSTRRAISFTTRKSPARRPSPMSGSARPDPLDLPHSVRPLHRLPSVQLHREDRRARADAAPAPRSCSTALRPDEVWDKLPRTVQEQIIDKTDQVLRDRRGESRPRVGHGDAHQHDHADLLLRHFRCLDRDKAIAKIKKSIEKTYGKKGEEVVRKNFEAVDHTVAHLYEVQVPAASPARIEMLPPVPPEAPEFVQNVTAMMMAGRGDELP
jgi:pyruvate-ferredoxin/flavodoxin oxidoreductase